MPSTKRMDEALIAVEWVPAQAACPAHGKWGCSQVECLVPHHVVNLTLEDRQAV